MIDEIKPREKIRKMFLIVLDTVIECTVLLIDVHSQILSKRELFDIEAKHLPFSPEDRKPDLNEEWPWS